MLKGRGAGVKGGGLPNPLFLFPHLSPFCSVSLLLQCQGTLECGLGSPRGLIVGREGFPFFVSRQGKVDQFTIRKYPQVSALGPSLGPGVFEGKVPLFDLGP
jgi:hypothetical protein